MCYCEISTSVLYYKWGDCMNPLNMWLLIFLGVFALVTRRARRWSDYENTAGVPGTNTVLQYIYALDEFYELRLKFDELIDPYWEKYRKNFMTREEYKRHSDEAVKKIIGPYYKDFDTLYKFGIRNAAIKVARDGFNPGQIKYPAGYSKFALKSWTPQTYPSIGGSGLYDHWNRCLSWHKQPFLTCYPNVWEFVNLGCGLYDQKTEKFTYVIAEERKLGMYAAAYGYGSNEKARRRVLEVLAERGYNGKTYTKLPDRNITGWTERGIELKYEFVVNTVYLNGEYIADHSADRKVYI